MPNDPLMYGGQAVIKGVMMRSPRFFAVACRRASDDITVRVERVALANRPGILKWPLIRGAMALVDAMHLGIKSLMWSASLAMEDIPESAGKNDGKAAKQAEAARKTASTAINDIAIGGAMVSGLGIGVFLFIVLPNLISGWMHHWLIHSTFGLNVMEGVLKMLFFLAYISLVGLMPDIREVFQYHGAEHRAINTLEGGKTLDLESTRSFGTIHVRCGTNFILIVLVLSIFVFSLLPWNSALERVALRLALLPLVAGIAYEIIRLAGRNVDSRAMRSLLAPGLALQYITTRPPSDAQVEVALSALRAAIDAENAGEGEPAEQRAAG